MLTLDKVAIINSFTKVVQLIKGVRTELLVEIDKLKYKEEQANRVVIDDSSTGPDAVWSAGKVKNFVAEQVAALLGGADESTDTLGEIAEQLKVMSANTQGILSADGPQSFSDVQKAQLLANLGIDKEFLLKLLVNDDEVSDNNLLTARKVDTLVKEAVLNFDTEAMVSDDELNEIMSNMTVVPAPEKAGQVLTAVTTEKGLELRWVDGVVTEPNDKETEESTGPVVDETVGENPDFEHGCIDGNCDIVVDENPDVPPPPAEEPETTEPEAPKPTKPVVTEEFVEDYDMTKRDGGGVANGKWVGHMEEERVPTPEQPVEKPVVTEEWIEEPKPEEPPVVEEWIEEPKPEEPPVIAEWVEKQNEPAPQPQPAVPQPDTYVPLDDEYENQ